MRKEQRREAGCPARNTWAYFGIGALSPGFGREPAANLAQTAPPVRPAWAAQVDRVFAEWDRPDSPGCAVALYKDGKAVYKHDKAYRTR